MAAPVPLPDRPPAGERSGPVRGARWRAVASRWRGQSSNRRIFSAMVTVGLATVLVKLGGMGRDLVVAYRFGTSDGMDAFVIAQMFPVYAITVIAGSLPAALIPVYVRVREREGTDEQRRFLASVFVTLAGLLGVGVLLLAAVAPALLAVSGARFGGAKLALTGQLFYLMLPAVVLSGFSAVCASVLNSGERFLLPALTPLVVSAVTVLALVGGGGGHDIHMLAVGLVAGYGAEALLLGWALYRRRLLALPGAAWHPEVGTVLRQYLPMVTGAAVMSSSPLVDQAMAASLGPGSVASLAYAGKLVAAGMGIGATAVSVAVFPHFSRMVAVSDWAGLRHTVRTYTRLLLLCTVPLVLVLVAFSEPIVRLLYQRGAFSAADTHAVAAIQSLYLLQIPFYVLGIMGVRLLSASGGNRVLMWISLWNFTLNLAGDYVFMHLMGVAGIALSTSLVYLSSCTMIWFFVRRRIRGMAAAPPS